MKKKNFYSAILLLVALVAIFSYRMGKTYSIEEPSPKKDKSVPAVNSSKPEAVPSPDNHLDDDADEEDAMKLALDEMRGGSPYSALAIIDEMQRKWPGHIPALELKAGILEGIGKTTDALDTYNALLDSEPENIGALLGRGRVLLAMGEPDLAIFEFTTALSKQGRNVDALFFRGIARARLKRFQPAIEDFSKAIEIRNDFPAALAERGNTWYDMEEYGKAVADYTSAIQVSTPTPDLLNNRGSSLMKMGEINVALDDFNHAISLAPQMLPSLANKAKALMSLGNYEEALNVFNRLIEIQPESSFTYRSRGWAHWMAGNLQESVADCEKAEALGDNSPDTIFIKGMALFYLDKLDEADACFVQAGKMRPDYPYYVFWHHLVMLRKGKNGENNLVHFANTVNDPSWPMPIAMVFLKRMPSFNCIRMARSRNPARQREMKAEALYYCGMHEILNGDKEFGITLLSQVQNARTFTHNEFSAAMRELENLGYKSR